MIIAEMDISQNDSIIIIRPFCLAGNNLIKLFFGEISRKDFYSPF